MTAPRLRILHVITGLNTGGAERMLYRLVKQQVRSSIQPSVISLLDGGQIGPLIEELGVTVHTLNMTRGHFSWNDWRRLRQLITDCAPDVVHSWMYHANILSFLSMLRLPKIPLLWHVHNAVDDMRQHKRLTASIVNLSILLSYSVDSVVYCGPKTARQHEGLGYDARKTSIIPNGIDCAEYRPNLGARLQLRSELGIPTDASVVGHIARLHPMKDHTNLLQAMQIVLKQRPLAHFVLAGNGVTVDNPTFVELMTDIGRDNIHLLGERKDIPRIMTSLDVFALSSRSAESFPLVIAEAMASGVPCVATDVGDSAWVVGDTGVVVPPSDPISLATGILRLLSLPQSEFSYFQRAARSRVSQQFSLESTERQFADLYDALVAQMVIQR